MKRVNNLYKNIYSISNIIYMYKKIRKNIRNKKEIFEFEKKLNSNINEIANTLYSKKYVFSKYKIFLISEPKYRLIMSENIKDKLVNHLVSKYILGSLEKSLIDTNVSTRKHKGSSYAFNMLVKYINKLRLINSDIFILKMDIKKYFYNIDHDILKKKLLNKIKDKDSINILFSIIDSTNEKYINEKIKKVKKVEISKLKDKSLIKEIENIPLYKYGKGLPIGNMTSQFLAVFYLNEIDHFIKEKLGFKYYIRYMDDLIIIDSDKEKLKKSLSLIKNKLNKEKLKLNNKTQIINLKNGFNFLGYNFRYNNKLYIKITNKTYYRVNRKLNYLLHNNYCSYYKSIRSYKGYFEKCNYKNYLIVLERGMKDKYFNIKNDNKLSIILIKKGAFYVTYDEDALIMWYLFDYKIINSKIGFPVFCIQKIVELLNNNNLNVLVLNGNDITKYEVVNNMYSLLLGLSHDKKEVELYINELNESVRLLVENNSENYTKIKDFLINI